MDRPDPDQPIRQDGIATKNSLQQHVAFPKQPSHRAKMAGPIAGIYYNRPKGDLRLKGPIDQLQTDFTFSLKQNRFWHMRLFPPDLVLDPTVRQVQACSYRPVKNAINIMSSHKDLAIINPAQRSAVLPPDAYGSCALFGKASVIKDQNPISDTCVGSHVLNSNLVHLLRVPFGSSKKFLQMLSVCTGQRFAVQKLFSCPCRTKVPWHNAPRRADFQIGARIDQKEPRIAQDQPMVLALPAK